MSRLTSDVVGGLLFLLIGVGLWLLAADLDLGTPLVPGPGALTKLALAFLILLSCGLVAVGLKDGPLGKGSVLLGLVSGRVLVTIALLLAFALALTTFGFLASSAILMPALAGLGAERPFSPKAMLGGLATAVIAYLLFAKLLGVPLPVGSFWGA
jgi:hypothetical protein